MPHRRKLLATHSKIVTGRGPNKWKMVYLGVGDVDVEAISDTKFTILILWHRCGEGLVRSVTGASVTHR